MCERSDAPQSLECSRPEDSTLESDMSGAGGKAETDLADYLTIRITIAHVDVPRMLEKIFSNDDYICFKHKGSNTNKEHVHILVPDITKNKKIKDRLAYNGYKGNESFSIKGMHNGLSKGIQYCSRECTKPIVHGDLQMYVDNAPKWETRNVQDYVNTSLKDDGRKDRDWQLNYSNLVPQAVRYAKTNKMTSCCLREVVKDMIAKTRWRPSREMYKNGVPDYYRKDYLFRLGQAKEPDMFWFDRDNF